MADPLLLHEPPHAEPPGGHRQDGREGEPEPVARPQVGAGRHGHPARHDEQHADDPPGMAGDISEVLPEPPVGHLLDAQGGKEHRRPQRAVQPGGEAGVRGGPTQTSPVPRLWKASQCGEGRGSARRPCRQKSLAGVRQIPTKHPIAIASSGMPKLREKNGMLRSGGTIQQVPQRDVRSQA